MKRLITSLTICCAIASCRKEILLEFKTTNYLNNVKAQLKDSLNLSFFETLDFSKANISGVDSLDIHVVSVPVSFNAQNSFVSVRTDKFGSILQGRVITLVKDESQNLQKSAGFNGSIHIQTLNQASILQSKVVDGYIVELTKGKSKDVPILSMSQPYVPLPASTPDVVDLGNLNEEGNITYSQWLRLVSMFNGGSTMPGSYYSPNTSDDYGGPGGSGSAQLPLIQIGFETQIVNPAIDIQAYLKCFSLIPDDGAVCSIELFADLPVDNDPNKLFNWHTESPGHTFIQITKTNGGKMVMQNIGFYPQTNWKTMLTPAPVKGKLVDNSNHEFNVSYKVNITPDQLKNALTQITYLSRFIKYDIDEYNCTDFALDIFNATRSYDSKLGIPKYDIPGGIAANGTSTPQGLYNKLKSMKQFGSPYVGNITIPYKGWVATSHGPCN